MKSNNTSMQEWLADDYITSLAQISCEEQFTEEVSREYEQWLDEREQEWERTIAYVDNNL